MSSPSHSKPKLRIARPNVPLPISYEEGSAAYFFFLVPIDKVNPLLQGKFDPARYLFGRALVAICFYEYRKTSIGPYNELGIGVMVHGQETHSWPVLDLLRKPERRGTGFFVLHLPVTSSAAEEAGRQIWGLPKFVTPIPFRLEGKVFEASVTNPDAARESLFQVRSQFGAGPSTKGLDLVLFNQHGGTAERSLVNVQAKFRTARCRRFELTLGSRSHPLTETLRRLGLEKAVPLGVQYTDRFVSQLHGPEPVVSPDR